jgi:RNA polymerase sigma-70 factor, ECF subfamily
VETEATVETYQATYDDKRIVKALQAGDEKVFMELVESLGPSMLRVALLFVRTRAVAEEVVQEAWVGVLSGIGRFEGRSSLKTWVFRILTNIAKTRGEREGRSVPFSSLASDDLESGVSSVEPDRFLPDGDRWAGHWASSPRRFDAEPESRLLGRETLVIVQRVVESLPETQRVVLTMRDIAGFEPEEVCDALGISEVNQRVLLHRGRSKVRSALESYLAEEETA